MKPGGPVVRASSRQLRRADAEERTSSDSESEDTSLIDAGMTPSRSYGPGSKVVAPTDAPDIFSWDVFVSAMTLRWLRRPDMSRRVSVQVFLEQQQQLALIWALLLSVVSSGMFSVSGLHLEHGATHDTLFVYVFKHLCGFFFCSSVIAFVFATFGCLLLMLAARTTPTDHEFMAMYQMLGSFLPSLPMIMGVYGILAAFCGLVAYFSLIFSEEYTWCCLSVCALSFPIMWYALMALTRAVHALEDHVSAHRLPQVSNADEIYDKLKAYYLECGSLKNVQRAEFLESIGCVDAGGAMSKLARRIYDDWMSKKIKSMIRPELDF